ncbi:MAG: hypothetical protein R3F45_14545 [Gammaproteobacteria bacterium]
MNLLDLIPIFHRWIQEQALDDLLIDVAEYTHMYRGPGVLVIAHEGNYGYDEAGGERGLVYYSKQNLPEPELAARMVTVACKGLQACARFLGETGLARQVAFPCNRIQVFANDRLRAPNTDTAWAEFEPAVNTLAARLFPDQDRSVQRCNSDSRDRLAAIIHTNKMTEPEALLARLG